MLTTKQLIAKYGKPTVDGKEYLVTINLPYPMRIAWDLDEKVTKMRCHKLVADKFKLVFNDIASNLNKGVNYIKLNLQSLESGTYNLVLETNFHRATKTLVKTK